MNPQTATKTTNESTPHTLTDWSVFADNNLFPARWKCDSYRGDQPADLSCHANIKPAVKDILRHIAGGVPDNGHEGRWFKVTFRRSDAEKAPPIWEELGKAGVEIWELVCPHCRKNLNPKQLAEDELIFHLNEHLGANRVRLEPRTLHMTLGIGKQKLNVEESDSL